MVLKKIKVQIDLRWDNAGKKDDDGRFFEEVYAALAGMQNPWRNSTMHLDKEYDKDDAKMIFDTVGSIMKRVADRMDEEGSPFARSSDRV